jgi:hypothetical protein
MTKTTDFLLLNLSACLSATNATETILVNYYIRLCEREFKKTLRIETHDELGDFLIKVKKQGEIIEMILCPGPSFDVVGYGYNFHMHFHHDGTNYGVEFINRHQCIKLLKQIRL